MGNYEKIQLMIFELKKQADSLHGNLTIGTARRMLVLSECVTAGLHAYLFKNLAFEDKPEDE